MTYQEVTPGLGAGRKTRGYFPGLGYREERKGRETGCRGGHLLGGDCSSGALQVVSGQD